MNTQNPVVGAFVVIAGAIGGLAVTLSVLLSGGNSLAQLCFYLLIGGAVLGLLAPRLAFPLWIVACAYSDLLKRLTVAFGDVTNRDLFWILGIAPAMFSAIVASLAVGGLTGAVTVRMRHWKLLLLGLALTCVTGLVFALEAGGSPQGALQGVANGGLYSLLLFVLPVLYPTPDQVLRVLRFIVWVFFPVALYGIVQQLQGFQPFEIAYLRTGLSIEIKQLLSDRVRAFSTLNSPTALGAVSALLLVVTRFLARLPGRRSMGRVPSWILTAAYAGALVASTSRSAPLLIALGMAAGWCFLTPGRTALFYGTLIASFVALVAAAPWLLGHLDEANLWMTADADAGTLAGQLASIGSYSDRLFGFANVLRNPAAWSFFGCWNGNPDLLPESLRHHDIVSATLLRFGLVPLIAAVAVLAWTLARLHRGFRNAADPARRQLLALSIALAGGLVFLSALSGNVLAVFPVNVFLWFFAGSALVASSDEAPQAAPDPMTRRSIADFAPLAGRTPGAKRFRPRRA